MSFISDSDANLELNLRNMLGKSQKKVEDSLPMPNNEKEDSLVVGNSLNSDLDLDSLMNEHFSDIKQHYSEQSDSLVIDDSVVLDGSIVNPISGLTYNTDNDVEIGKESDIEIEDSTDISHVFSDISQTNPQSSIATNISDKGISLEGGLDFDKNGNVDAWDIDLGIDYSSSDSGTALLKEEDIADLYEQSDEEDTEIHDSINYEDEDSAIFDLDAPENNESYNDDSRLSRSDYAIQAYKEPPLWVVFLIMFTSGVMLISGLITLDVLVCMGCPPGRNCHRPLLELVSQTLFGW